MSNQYYITKPKSDVKIFCNNLGQFIKELEKICLESSGKTRNEWVDFTLDLGYFDDSDATFYQTMLDQGLRSGVLRDGEPIECNVFEVDRFAQPEYGD